MKGIARLLESPQEAVERYHSDPTIRWIMKQIEFIYSMDIPRIYLDLKAQQVSIKPSIKAQARIDMLQGELNKYIKRSHPLIFESLKQNEYDNTEQNIC